MKFAQMSLPTRGWEEKMCGLRYGQDLENQAAHPHQEFPGVPPRAKRQSNFIVTLTLRDCLIFSF